MTDRTKHVAKFDSFEECERADRQFYLSLSPQERVDMLLDLIARHVEALGETGKGLARVHRVVELPQR